MGYRFRLETVLNLKRRLQEAAQMELSRIDTMKRSREEELAAERQRLNTLRDKQRTQLCHGMSAEEFLLMQDAIFITEKRIQITKEELSKLDIERRKARHNLVNRHREKRLMEKLREKDLAKYKESEQKQQQLEADEFTSIKFSRNKEE